MKSLRRVIFAFLVLFVFVQIVGFILSGMGIIMRILDVDMSNMGVPNYGMMRYQFYVAMTMYASMFFGALSVGALSLVLLCQIVIYTFSRQVKFFFYPIFWVIILLYWLGFIISWAGIILPEIPLITNIPFESEWFLGGLSLWMFLQFGVTLRTVLMMRKDMKRNSFKQNIIEFQTLEKNSSRLILGILSGVGGLILFNWVPLFLGLYGRNILTEP